MSCKGITILKNCAIEPEIKDLTNFLNSAGANIKWSGRTCKIKGVNSLKKLNILLCQTESKQAHSVWLHH